MLIHLLRPTMIAGEPVPAGSTTDVDPSVATLLIGIGKAEAAKPEAPSAAPVEPPVLDDEAPAPAPAKPARRAR